VGVINAERVQYFCCLTADEEKCVAENNVKADEDILRSVKKDV
jgi:hypothetical protein